MKCVRFQRIAGNWWLTVICCSIIKASIVLAQSSDATPANFKIAFLGDQGSGSNASAVLNLIKAEGAQAALHLGDFDYADDPAAWEAQINSVLGADFPYFACIGNHDEQEWAGPNGYQSYLQDRLKRLGIAWEGDLGVKSSLRYKGIFFVLTAPGIMGSGHDAYIRDKLAADNSVWSISGWHKNMRLMQVGGKSDETGWGVYEESCKGGAIIATAHEHSYSRTYLLSRIINPIVASRSDTLIISKGQTFVFVSGLGGESVRDQELSGEWWARIYTSAQGAKCGAVFGVFNVNGIRNLANFYFKDINNRIADRFVVISHVEGDTAVDDAIPASPNDFILEQNYPNPFGSEGYLPAAGGSLVTAIRFRLSKPARTKLTILNLLGEQVRILAEGEMLEGWHHQQWDGRDDLGHRVPSGVYLYRFESDHQIVTRKLLVLR